jgi:hypothetical protein
MWGLAGTVDSSFQPTVQSVGAVLQYLARRSRFESQVCREGSCTLLLFRLRALDRSARAEHGTRLWALLAVGVPWAVVVERRGRATDAFLLATGPSPVLDS